MIYLAMGLIMISQLANSLCDAIKFSRKEIADRYDNLWHWLKWPVDRVCLFLAGMFSFPVICDQFEQHDIWHYTNEFFCLIVIIMLSFVTWQLHYKYWKNRFRLS